MPLGLWKSKWEIHREDAEHYREETRADRARWEAEARDLRERSDGLRADYSREIGETRLFNRELLIRLEKTYANLGTTLGLMGDEIIALRGEIHDLKDAVAAQTQAIMRLVDCFEGNGPQPPV
jgi:hypothetical protein